MDEIIFGTARGSSITNLDMRSIMGLRIRTNMAAINAQRRLHQSTSSVQGSMAKLSSGKRINKAADDAGGLAISEHMRADVRSLTQAKRNAADGISLVQTAEGSLVETASMLVRLRELAVQSASDTVGNTERGFIDKEYLALKDEIDRIANATEFNGTRLLTGKVESSDDNLNNPENTFPLEIQVSKDYYAEADHVSDADNPVNIIRIGLEDINGFTEGEGSLGIGRNENGTRVNGKQAAQQSINVLDGAITKVNDYRAYLGAIQNRLGSAVTNLGVNIENIHSAKSRIQDTDFAEETAVYTKNSILQNAGTSLLANANQTTGMAMQLIQGL